MTGAQGETGAEGVGGTPHRRVRQQGRAQQQHREPPRPRLGQPEQRRLGRRTVPHERHRHEQCAAPDQHRQAGPRRPGDDTRAAVRAEDQRPYSRRQHAQQPSQRPARTAVRRPHPRSRGHDRDQWHGHPRPHPRRPQRTARGVQGRGRGDGEVAEDDTRPGGAGGNQRRPVARPRGVTEAVVLVAGVPGEVVVLASRAAVRGVPRGPVQQPHGQREQQQRGDADGGGDAGERVGADQFGSVGQQPQRGRHVQRAAGAAVGIRGADPEHHHEHGERGEPQARRDRTSQQAAGQSGRTVAHPREQG